MNEPHLTFDAALSHYSTQAQQPVVVSALFVDRVEKARRAEVARITLLRRLGAGVGLLVLIAVGVAFLQPKTMTATYERATRQATEVPSRLSDWNVDVAKFTERATTPAKGLFSSIQRVTLPTSTPELNLNSKLPNLSTVPQAALDPLTNGPRRTLALFLRDTGFGSH